MSPKAINKELFYQCNICASKPQVRADKKNSMIFCKVISGGKRCVHSLSLVCHAIFLNLFHTSFISNNVSYIFLFCL